MISTYMRSVDYKAYHHQSYHISALKSLTRLRFKLISIRTKHYNMMTKVLDVIFPEFKPLKVSGSSQQLSSFQNMVMFHFSPTPLKCYPTQVSILQSNNLEQCLLRASLSNVAASIYVPRSLMFA